MSTHGPHCWRSTVLIYEEVGEGENTKGRKNLNQLVLKTIHFASRLFDHSVFLLLLSGIASLFSARELNYSCL